MFLFQNVHAYQVLCSPMPAVYTQGDGTEFIPFRTPLVKLNREQIIIRSKAHEKGDVFPAVPILLLLLDANRRSASS